MDFTISKYRTLISTIKQAGYQIITFEDYLTNSPNGKFVILRHDVDELAKNALRMAEEENCLGIRATYYFRIVKQSNQPDVIRTIVTMGHEIGYHYEDLSASEGDMETAIASFQKHLNYFRQFYPIKTICMHGSATSCYDNRSLWKHYNLADYGIIGEPYLSIDFNSIYYLTDTGYAWDGGKYAVRDVVANNHGITFHSTDEIIDALSLGKFPEQCMILAHTLWCDTLKQWCFLHLREGLRNKLKVMSKKNAFISKIYSQLVKFYWKR